MYKINALLWFCIVSQSSIVTVKLRYSFGDYYEDVGYFFRLKNYKFIKGKIKIAEKRNKKKNNFLVMADGGENHFCDISTLCPHIHQSPPTKIDYVLILLINKI